MKQNLLNNPGTKVGAEDLADLKALCQNDLKFLCGAILGYEDWDTVHDDIEAMLKRESRRKLVLVPRGHLKSAIITKAFTVQLLLRDPNLRVLIAHEVWDKSKEMLSEIKQYFTDKTLLPTIFGQFKTDTRWNQDEIVIKQRTRALSAPSIGTTGVETEMTSTHYDVIICDDLQGLQNSQTAEQRDKVKRFYQSLLDLLEPGGLLIIVGTRWHMDDLYQQILDEESAYFDVMVRKVVENGVTIFPKKFNLKFDEKSKSWAKSDTLCLDYITYLKNSKWDFSAQYMNDPTDDANQLFKRDYFSYWQNRDKNAPNYVDFNGLFKVMTVDPAISEKQEADYTAIVITGMDKNHKIYLLDFARGHWGPKDIIENMFNTYLKWRPNISGFEAIGFQRTIKWAMEEEMKRRKLHFPIDEVKQATNVTKEFRIKALEPYYRGKTIFHPEWMKNGEIENELAAFPRGKHDDLIDALSMSLNFLVPGSAVHNSEIPVGSWEYFAKTARQTINAKDFFNS